MRIGAFFLASAIVVFLMAFVGNDIEDRSYKIMLGGLAILFLLIGFGLAIAEIFFGYKFQI
jgi:hypothetical protein